MKKLKIALFVLTLVAISIGIIFFRQARKEKEDFQAYETEKAIYTEGQKLFESGDLTGAEKNFASLVRHSENSQANWAELGNRSKQYFAVITWKRSEKLYEQYVRVYTTRTQELLPDAQEILDGYKLFEDNYSSIIEKQGFTDSDTAWQIENDLATAVVWQLVVRWSMQNAAIEDLKILYDEALAHYKKAMTHAKKVQKTDDGDAVRYVSQNLDFMTRIDPLLDKSEGQGNSKNEQDGDGKGGPRKGLGDFLSNARAKASQGQGRGLGQLLDSDGRALGAKFLPLPMKGVGNRRLTGGTK